MEDGKVEYKYLKKAERDKEMEGQEWVGVGRSAKRMTITCAI